MIDFIDYVRSLPKAELHLHIEGTLEPEMLIKLAEKHQVDLPYSTAADVARAYEFGDLQSFLDLYYLGASVLVLLRFEGKFHTDQQKMESVHLQIQTLIDEVFVPCVLEV